MRRLLRTILILALITVSGGVRADTVLVHSSVQERSVSRHFVLSVFSMRVREWPNGQQLKVFVLPDEHPAHVQFVKTSLGIFPYQLRNIWDRAVFSGAGSSPLEVQSEQEMLEKIRTVEGAVGYVSVQQIPVEGVKQLEIQ